MSMLKKFDAGPYGELPQAKYKLVGHRTEMGSGPGNENRCEVYLRVWKDPSAAVDGLPPIANSVTVQIPWSTDLAKFWSGRRATMPAGWKNIVNGIYLTVMALPEYATAISDEAPDVDEPKP